MPEFAQELILTSEDEKVTSSALKEGPLCYKPLPQTRSRYLTPKKQQEEGDD